MFLTARASVLPIGLLKLSVKIFLTSSGIDPYAEESRSSAKRSRKDEEKRTFEKIMLKTKSTVAVDRCLRVCGSFFVAFSQKLEEEFQDPD